MSNPHSLFSKNADIPTPLNSFMVNKAFNYQCTPTIDALLCRAAQSPPGLPVLTRPVQVLSQQADKEAIFDMLSRRAKVPAMPPKRPNPSSDYKKLKRVMTPHSHAQTEDMDQVMQPQQSFMESYRASKKRQPLVGKILAE